MSLESTTSHLAALSMTKSLATSPYQQLDGPGLGKHALRLLQILPGNFDEDINIKLEIHSIEEPPKYYALSYCWGHDMSKTPAIVNDYPLPITQNLEAGLRHLRSRTKTRTLWVDALCINQDDMDERSQQVQIMGSIYSKAARVVVWLGLPTDGSDYIMHCLERGRVRTKKVPYFIHYLALLMERPWFYRVWTLQETLLASKDPILMVGHESQPLSYFIDFVVQDKVAEAPFKIFSAARDELNALPLHWIEFMAKEDPADVFNNRAGPVDVEQALLDSIDLMGRRLVKILWLIDTLDSHGNPGTFEKVNLTHYLHMTRHRCASDPRDKIYGLLGICYFSKPEKTLIPDYKAPVSFVFSQAMALIIKEAFVYGYPSMPLDTGERRTQLNLPSWVPDFTYTNYRQFPTTTVKPSSNALELEHTNEPKELCPSTCSDFDLLSDSAAIARFSEDFRVLYTMGQSLGSIIASRYLGFPKVEDAVDGLEFLMGLYTLLEAHHDDVIMTKIMKALSGPAKNNADACIENFVDNLKKCQQHEDAPHDDLDELAESVMIWFDGPHIYRGRTLFLTDTGQIGLTIGTPQVGDIVAGLFGSNFPFVLRKRGNEEGHTMINVACVVDHSWGHDFPRFGDDFDGDFTRFGLQEYSIY